MPTPSSSLELSPRSFANLDLGFLGDGVAAVDLRTHPEWFSTRACHWNGYRGRRAIRLGIAPGDRLGQLLCLQRCDALL